MYNMPIDLHRKGYYWFEFISSIDGEEENLITKKEKQKERIKWIKYWKIRITKKESKTLISDQCNWKTWWLI